MIDGWSDVVIGSDEVGYGAWAGPLVVCAVAAPAGWDDDRVTDSKLVESVKDRERLFELFRHDARFTVSIVEVSAQSIDRMGVRHALPYAHTQALTTVANQLSGALLGVVDGSLPVFRWELPMRTIALPKADLLVPECGLASILAKVTRDRIMTALDQEFPGYGWASNWGYGGNPDHEAGLTRLGPCAQHRASYEPIATMLAERDQALQPLSAWELLDED